MLAVPPPTLTQEGVTGDRLSAAKPIAIACGPVRFPTGAPLGLMTAAVHGFRLLRDRGAGPEAWDAEAKVWRPAAAGVPDPEPLFLKDDLWQGILVAAGQKDAAGADKLLSDPSTHLPRYSVACVFRGTDAAGVEHAGESTPTTPFEVLPPGTENLAGIALAPSADPTQTTEIRMFLAGSPGSEIGRVAITRSGSAARVTVTAGGATIVLQPNGAIDLTPASTQRVTVHGNLHVTGTLSTPSHSWT